MSHEHPAEPEFEGNIAPTVQESTPHWPAGVSAKGKPNVVLVALDDTGFSHLGCYGSSIDTPNIDRLASEGLTFTGFHTTALCSSSRACLLTGRNHHAVGMRAVSNMDTGYPNMRGAVTRSAATIAELLRDNGFTTFASGKWHLAPMAECTAAGPYHNWPLQRGFDRYYGFLQGETDQFNPELTCDNHFVSQPKSAEDGYHVSEDIVDKAIGFVRDTVSIVPERPFLLYLAFGATHSPHQAPAEYLEKYRGRFDEGWDVARERWFAHQKELGIMPQDTRLAPRNPGVNAWDELSNNEQRFAARLQEAFAAMLDHTDDQIGRLMNFLDELDIADNTIFMLVSDNGASQEGGPTGVFDEMKYFNMMREDVDKAVTRLDDIGTINSHTNIPWGWAQAGNTPLKWYKQNTHGGGVRDPFILRWPAALGRTGAIRTQFCHAIDIVPTLLDLLSIEMPRTVAGIAQMPLHGGSLRDILFNPNATPARSTQYFEMGGDRGIWIDGWKAVTHHRRGVAYADDQWELYHLDEDFSEFHDLAAQEPERLEAMIATWWKEAEAHGVLPLDDRGALDLFRASRRPEMPTSRNHFVYYPPVSHIVADACPSVVRGWRMTVALNHPEGANGALVARGNINSGYVFYISDSYLVFDYNCFHDHTLVKSGASIDAGRHDLTATVTRNEDGTGDVVLAIDGSQVGSGRIPRMLAMISSTGMDLGYSAAAVNDDYKSPFTYPGKIHRVEFDLPPSRRDTSDKEDEATVRAALSRQ
ncbi:MAG TPA: arylsulfatase [Pseudomonadales bacterium]|nr:arylsulfatase [Pseudomonadales bacterium]